MNRELFCTASLLATVLLGVSGVLTVGQAQGEEKVKPARSSAAEPDVTLTAGTWKDIEALVQAHRGRIVVVDIWSTSCLPCMTEFPNLVKLHQAHKGNVVCVSFNVDYVGIKNKPAEQYRARVEEFVKKQKAEFTNILSTTESDEVFKTLELSSIPAVYVFGADGKEAKRFDDSLLQDGEEEAFTYEKDIDPFVNSLVEKLKQPNE